MEVRVVVAHHYAPVASATASEAAQMQWGLGGYLAPEDAAPLYMHSELSVYFDEIKMFESVGSLMMCFRSAAFAFVGHPEATKAIYEEFQRQQRRFDDPES